MNELNLEKAMRIYYFLLKEGELTFDNSRELYLDYSDSEVRGLLEIMVRESEVSIEKYNQVVYLIPHEENDVIGINKLTHLMTYNFLDSARLEVIEKLFEP